jgi:hypothetical protein
MLDWINSFTNHFRKSMPFFASPDGSGNQKITLFRRDFLLKRTAGNTFLNNPNVLLPKFRDKVL